MSIYNTPEKQCAELAHEANRILCRVLGDSSQVHWDEAPEWQRESAVKGVIVALNGATPRQQHEAWMADKIANGRVYGETKNVDKKTHPCLVDYDELPDGQRRKDMLYIAVVKAMYEALK